MSAPAVSGEVSRSSMLAMRRRGVWEAADSGVLLWRKNFSYMIPFFALPVWVIGFCLALVPEEMRVFSWIGLWWLKPLFDRLALHLISVRFFENPRAKTPLLRGLGGNMVRGLLGDLLWRRLSPGRSGLMPLRVLERLKLKKCRRRKKDLAAGGLGFASFVTVICLVLEWFLLGGEILFFYNIFQLFYPGMFASLGEFAAEAELVIFAAYCVNYMLTETLYTAMGFGLYINSRVETEGWDLQLLFQNFARQKVFETPLPPGAKKRVPLYSKILLIFSFSIFLLFPVKANSSEETEQDFFPEGFLPSSSIPAEALEEVLASPDFGGVREEWGIVFKGDREEDDAEEEVDFAPWLQRLKEFLGSTLRVLLCTAFGGFAIFALYRWRRYRKNSSSGRFKDGLNYRNPFLSADRAETLFNKAAGFFGAGNIREAWAACLQGTIAAYAQYGGVSFPQDATEYACLALVRGAGGEGRFGALVENWILLAYAGKEPPRGSFEDALEFGRALTGKGKGRNA